MGYLTSHFFINELDYDLIRWRREEFLLLCFFRNRRHCWSRISDLCFSLVVEIINSIGIRSRWCVYITGFGNQRNGFLHV